MLAPAEIRSLFAVMRGLAAEGRSIVFISHKLDEVMEISRPDHRAQEGTAGRGARSGGDEREGRSPA